MKKLLTKVDILSSVLTLCSMIPGALIYSKLPERLPKQFDMNFQPIEYVDKAVFVFLTPAVIAAASLLACALSNFLTRKNNKDILNELVRFAMPVSAFFVQIITILYVFGRIKHIGTVMCVVVSLTYIILGNYLPKVRRNFLLGIKTPHTLKSETVWKNTHRLAGFMWIVGGIVMLTFALMSKYLIVCIILMAVNILPVVYSVFDYYSMKKQDEQSAENESINAL